MATKNLNVRIQNVIDTYANWTAANPTPLDGEICIVVVPAKAGAVAQEPAVLIKVGDGTTPFNNLSYNSAIAADVYDWAKAATKPTYAANEITGMDSYISDYVNDQMGISVDTDTQYKIVKVDDYNYKLQSKGKGDAAWADVADGAIAIPKYDDATVKAGIEALEALVGNIAVATQISNAIATVKSELIGTDSDTSAADTIKGAKKYADEKAAGALADAKTYADGKDAAIAAAKKAGDDAASAAATADGKAVAAQGEVDALEAKVGTVTEGKTVVQMIEEAKSSATYDDTELAGRVTAVEGKATTLIGEDAGKSVRAIATDEATKAVNDFATKVSDDNVVNSFKELVDWAAAHGSEAAEMAAAITAIQAIVDGIGGEGEQPTVVAYVTEAINALKIGDYAKAADLTALAARVATLEGDSHTHANKNVLDGITATKVAAWDTALQKADIASGSANGTIAVDGTDVAVKGLGTAAYATTGDFDVAGAADTAKAAVIGNASDASSADTIKGAKKYAEEKAAAAANKIETIKVNGTAQTPDANKAVDITVPTGALSEKDEVAKTDLAAALKTEIEGKANTADMADIATSGNVNDLVQTSGDYIIFNCGNAASLA